MFGLLLSQPAVIVNHHWSATNHIFDLPKVATLIAAAEKCENACCCPIYLNQGKARLSPGFERFYRFIGLKQKVVQSSQAAPKMCQKLTRTIRQPQP